MSHLDTLQVDLDEVKDKFSDEWQERLDFSKKGDYFIVKLKHFLGGAQFIGELASILRDMGFLAATEPE